MLARNQLPAVLRSIVDEQVQLHGRPRTVTQVDTIPDTGQIPIEDPTQWLRIPSIIAVFVDMKGSTQLSAATKDKETAGAYQLFTGTAVRLFDELDSPYIDVRGDGVLALFDGGRPHRALAAAVTFKTFASEVFVPTMLAATGIQLGAHIGIDRKTVLVRKIGLKRRGNRTDRQNEVWAGKPVNMAAKLSGLAAPGELLVSDRFLVTLRNEKALNSCGCVAGQPTSKRTPLWSQIDLRGNSLFDFTTAYKLLSVWCQNHGAQYCSDLIVADN